MFDAKINQLIKFRTSLGVYFFAIIHSQVIKFYKSIVVIEQINDVTFNKKTKQKVIAEINPLGTSILQILSLLRVEVKRKRNESVTENEPFK